MSGITVEPANGTLSPGENTTLALPWPQLECLQSFSTFFNIFQHLLCFVRVTVRWINLRPKKMISNIFKHLYIYN